MSSVIDNPKYSPQSTTGEENPYQISRSIYHLQTLESDYETQNRYSKTPGERLEKLKSSFKVSSKCIGSFFLSIFPFIRIMSAYNLKTDLLGDAISGFTIGIMQIPQGMAYAMLARVPPVYGLYVSFFPLIIYFFFGTSKHVSVGTFAVISLMVGSSVDNNYESILPPQINYNGTNMGNSSSMPNNTNCDRDCQEEKAKVSIAVAVTLIVGLMQLGMGILRLGFLTIYLSDPLTRGFTTGCAFHVFTSQLSNVFGIQVKRFSGALKLIYTYIDFFKNIKSIVWASLIIAIICLIILYIVKEYVNPIVKRKIKAPLPIELFIVIIATLASHFGKFNEKFNLKIVGDIPSGIPAPKAPDFDLFRKVVTEAIPISIVSFAISVSMVKLFAKKHQYEIDANQELIAYGLTNGISSFFNCFVSSVSLTRTLVQEQVGGKTQLASLFSCVLILIVLLAIGRLFKSLPNAVLAAIILIALKGMFLQFKDLKKLWHLCKYDFFIWLVAFLATVILDVDLGLVVAIGFSLLTVIFRSQRPYTAILGRIPETDIYKDITTIKNIEEIDGIVIFRFEAPLFYANKEHFTEKIFAKTNLNARKLKLDEVGFKKKKNDLEIKLNNGKISSDNYQGLLEKLNDKKQPIDCHTMILDCSCIGYMDSVGISTLSQVAGDFEDIGVTLLLASCKEGITDMLETGRFFKLFDKDRVFVSVHDAVLDAIKRNDKNSNYNDNNEEKINLGEITFM